MHHRFITQALTAPPSNGLQDTGVPSLQLAAAIAASVYFLRENKRLGLGEDKKWSGDGQIDGQPLSELQQNSAKGCSAYCYHFCLASATYRCQKLLSSLLNHSAEGAVQRLPLHGAGKAAAVTGGGFVLGSIVGTLLQQWLRVDIVPLGVCTCGLLPP